MAKLIITERQLGIIKKVITENSMHSDLVERLVKDLDANYEPMLGIMREDGEYYEEPMIKIKADESETSVKDVYDYFKKKYKLGDRFTQQVIKDWMFGNIKDNKLSKNVPLS